MKTAPAPLPRHALLIKWAVGVFIVFACASSEAAMAQLLYYWKDATTGQSQMSTVAPTWYKADAPVNGPRVVVTRGKRTIDDTSLPLRDRLSMAGWPEAAIDARLEAIGNPAPQRQKRPGPY